MPDFDGEKLNSAQKIFKKIQESLDYESGYHAQSFEAYNIYSNLYALLKGHRKGTDIDTAIETLLHNNRRSNIYYANVETLKGLILPQMPSLQLSLNPSKKTENNKETKNFYNVCANILSVIVKNTIDNMRHGVWDAFKLDYIITGRGVLWASLDEDSDGNKSVSIDNVRWQDFAMDTKPTWESVSWVARRRLYTKRQFKETFNVPEEKISGAITLDSVYGDVALFDSFGDNSSYIEVWEYWDKPTLTQYYVSKQYNVEADSESLRYIISKKKYEDADPDYFLPTAEPPMLMYNGINLIPFSDVWTYINELTELSQITQKRTNLISSLHLRGYTDTARANVINALSSATHNGLGLEEDDNIVAVPGFTPNPQDPLIYYVDNMPRLQLLDFLQKEYQFLVERIYSLTGISEQMRNVTSNEDDETATSVRLKSKFGSRRLKEHQQRLLNYWVGILKILLHRICQAYEIKDLKEIFSYDFRDSAKKDIQETIFERAEVVNQLKAVQAQMQAQSSQQPQDEGEDQGQPQPQADQQQMANAGGFPPPDMSGGMPPPQPMQAQGEQNQNQAQGMAGSQLPDATVIQQASASDQDQDQQSTNPTTPFGTMGQPTEQTGVDEDQQDAMAQQQAMQQQGGASQPMADQSQGDQSQQQAQQPDLNAQNEQLLQQEMELSEKYEALINEVTWERILKFFREDKMVSLLVTAHLDDLENKIISDEKKNSDLEYMNTIVNLVNQIIANVNSNPKFADIYCSIFSLSLDNFDQTKAQRDAIDEFITQIKKVAENLINNPPQQPPPSPEDMKNQAAAQELQAKAQLLQVQAQELSVKIQLMQQGIGSDLQQQQGGAGAGDQDKMQELQMKHQHDMELQQAKIQADQSKYQDKMEADRQLLQMKIQADKERYDEKIKADYLEKNINEQTPTDTYPQV